MPEARSMLLERLGVRVPIFQAPMAGVSTPAMAAAVAEAGGLGALGVGAMTVAQAREAIHAVRRSCDGPFQVNVFTHPPARADATKEAAWLARLRPEFERWGGEPPRALREIYASFLDDAAMCAMLVEERPRAVSFHFGLPTRAQIEALHDAGIVLLATATNLQEARAIEGAGLDAIVAQGIEAGGHRGVFDPDAEDDALGTMALTRVLVRNAGIPIVAAGGIMDGAGIASALALGAQAAQLGTAFVVTDESLADAAYRARLSSPAAQHTVMTRAISGRPARCLPNDFTRWGAEVPQEAIPDYPIAYDAGKALHAAAKSKGHGDYGAQWAGQGAPLARAMSTKQLMERLIEELRIARGH